MGLSRWILNTSHLDCIINQDSWFFSFNFRIARFCPNQAPPPLFMSWARLLEAMIVSTGNWALQHHDKGLFCTGFSTFFYFPSCNFCLTCDKVPSHTRNRLFNLQGLGLHKIFYSFTLCGKKFVSLFICSYDQPIVKGH